jgi:tRNA-binding EMAP/Myf-like protein
VACIGAGEEEKAMAVALSLAPAGQQLVKAEKVKRMQLAVGEICEAWREPAADRQMYRLVIDLGPVLGKRHITSVITNLGPDEPVNSAAQLIGKRVLVGGRIEWREVLGEVSQGLMCSGHTDPEEETVSFPLFVSEHMPVGTLVW